MIRKFIHVLTYAVILIISFTLNAAPGGNPKSSSSGNKSSICHFDEDVGLFHVITISNNAVAKHFSNHGDAYPGEYFSDTDGDGLGDALGMLDLCPNPGFVANDLDQCPDEAADTDDGCLAPTNVAGSDLVVGNGQWLANSNNGNILFGDGAGGFTLQSYNTVLGGSTVAVADLNGDGHDDFVQSAYNSSQIYVGIGDGAGNVFVSYAATLTPDPFQGAGPQAVAVGDLDNDGDLDLVYGVQGYYLYILENDGNAGFTQVLKHNNGYDRNRAVAIADFDGDGAADIVAIGEGPGAITITYGDPAPGINFDPSITLGFPCSNKLEVADLNGDGRPDLATGNWCLGGTQVYLNDGTPDLSPGVNYAGNGSGSLMMASADLDGDGSVDLIVGDSSVNVYYNNGTGGFSNSPVSYAVTHGVGRSAIGDFNEDGLLDLAIANRNAHKVTILEGSNTGGFAAENIISSGNFSYPESIAAGNFD